MSLITNLTGLEKPLEKLVETVSEGVGVVGNHFFKFDVAKIKRVGSAEAQVEKEKIITKAEAQAQAQAQAQEKSFEILGRAEKRFALDQYNKQINLENTLVRSKDDLEGKTVSSDPVEKDWVRRFLDIAQNISRDELQDVLARILSGEVQCPGSYSYQTLEVVKYLSKKDLERFLKFVAISTHVGVIKLHRAGNESLERYGLEFEDYLDLSSIGLFNQSSTLSYNIDLLPSSNISLKIGADSFLLSNNGTEVTKKIDFGLYVFSKTGKELRLLLSGKAVNEKSELFKNDFMEEVKKKGLDIARS